MSEIKLENITKAYGKHVILHNFNLTIQHGEFISIIGGSGSGKTTVLKLINGILKPQDGAVYVDHKNIAEINQNELRRNIGYVLQSIGLFPHMNVYSNITYVLKLQKQNKAAIEQRVQELIKIVELDESLLQRYPDELSGGQKQRVGIARALAATPSLLLMDEPFGAVDEITRHSLQDEIIKIHNKLGITIVFVTHDIQEALRLGDKIIIMKDGNIEQYDTAENIMKHPATNFARQLLSYTNL